MRLLLAIVLSCLFCSLAVAEHNQLTSEQIADGWIALFDGETLFGWQPSSDAIWRVENGVICVDSGEPGSLMTTSQFSDYELQLEFRCKARTKDRQDERWHRIDVDRSWTQEHGYKTIWQGGVELLDEFPTSPVTDPKLAAGRIGLSFQKGKIEFRNIRLRPKSLKPIFNGKDLTGWNTDRADASRFEVTEQGELRVLDGRGQLESDAVYRDFVLQLECFVDGDALNSGVFFRCIPGDFMMGYECQIQNGMKEGDPTQPADCGTGGFFRRQNARRIVARDREWFAMTLIADGPHMAAWVEGQQVSDWTDTRKPHENPRKGLRLEPGTFAIQGHDPTTDLRFRKLQIVEMPKEEKK